ncbi:hypothetical protein IHV25_01025 [Phaeovibrio sulfidiphilus]|uniref:Autotransporter domain-containing protein n=1 Tax=Phaeovibrio sulfidiphilus TaxID=1220600 RepID=A0A8J6YTP5_9PROT|nr:hypothetical protein [Phaeovibrio sulfidiphilus]MBE1236239.1 hypothetical protein [Phaeovibrio sulfidiphilus]
MKVSIRRSGVVASALALALAVPALSAGDARAAVYTVTGGAGSSTAGTNGGLGTWGNAASPTATVPSTSVDGASVNVTPSTTANSLGPTTPAYAPLGNTDTLTVTGGAAGTVGNGGAASWTGAFNPAAAATDRVTSILITGGAGNAASIMKAGSASVSITGDLKIGGAYVAAAGATPGTGLLTVAAGAGATATGATNASAGASAGYSQTGSLTIDSTLAADLATAGTFANVVNYNAGGVSAGAGSATGGNGGNTGDTVFNIGGNLTVGNTDTSGKRMLGVSFGALNGGAGAATSASATTGVGGNGGLTTVNVTGATSILGGYAVTAGAGGVGNGGNGGNGGSTVVTHGGAVTIGSSATSLQGLQTMSAGSGGAVTAALAGSGGAGGSLTETYNSTLTVYGARSLAAGLGGAVGAGGTGNGGAGGSVVATYNDTVIITGANLGVAGNSTTYGGFRGNAGSGGASAGSGKGGQGGSVTEVYKKGFTAGNKAHATANVALFGFAAQAGSGGNGSNASGSGGGGGSYTLTAGGAATAYGGFDSYAGGGGVGGAAGASVKGGTGGRGGDLVLEFDDTLTVGIDAHTGNPYATGLFRVYGFGGGAGGTGSAALAGTGGDGGNSTLTVGKMATLEGWTTIDPGKAGDSGDGVGGNAGTGTYTFGSKLTRTERAIDSVNKNAGSNFQVFGGDGGNSTGLGMAGRGGDATLTVMGIAYIADGFQLAAGDGGIAGSSTATTTSGAGSKAGRGGDLNAHFYSDVVALAGASIGTAVVVPVSDSVAPPATATTGGNVGGHATIVNAGNGGDSGDARIVMDRDYLGTATSFVDSGKGGSALANSTGNAGNGGFVDLHVKRDMIFSQRSSGRSGDGGATPVATATGKSGDGGALKVTVDRVFGARTVKFNGGKGTDATATAAGASAADVTINVGTFQISGVTGSSVSYFYGGNAGAGATSKTGGKGGNVVVNVNKNAAYYGNQFQLIAGNTAAANGGTSGTAGNVTYDANIGGRDGHVVIVGDMAMQGGDGATGANTAAGSVSFKSNTLILTANSAGGVISGTKTTGAGTDVKGGGVSVGTTYLRTKAGGTGYTLNILRNNGTASVSATNVVAAGEDFTVNLNKNAATTASQYNVGFTTLGATRGATLSVNSQDNSRLFTWNQSNSQAYLYAANAVDGFGDARVNKANTMLVTQSSTAGGTTTDVYDQVDASGRVMALDVANLRHVDQAAATMDTLPQILNVNGDITKTGYGVKTNTATGVALLGADNLRIGEKVKLVNLSNGSTFTTHSGAGTIGDTFGNVADATYTTAIEKDSTGKTYLTLKIDSFDIRKDWVIDNSRLLVTETDTDLRDLTVPGTLSIVDNRYKGAEDMVVRVDNSEGDRGQANLWASAISVETTNTPSGEWIEIAAQRTSTTLDFTGAMSGDVNDKTVAGVAFNTLAIKSGSWLALNGDQNTTTTTGADNYAFGGNLEVGEMFRGTHTSARLTNTTVSGASTALHVTKFTGHLSNDLPGQVGFADAWMKEFDGQRYANDSAGNANKLVTDRGGNGVVVLEVVGGQAPVVSFDTMGSVDLTQALGSTDGMETLRKAYAKDGVHNPRLTLIDTINSDLSTINGKTFAENASASVEARSWAQRGFIEGAYKVSYGIDDNGDKTIDWGTKDSVVAEFTGLAADLGKSALQARTAAETLVNQGQDLLVDAFDNALPLGAYNPAKGMQPVAMVSVGGGHSKVKTGSDVSGTGFSLAAGPGVALDHEYGRTTVGVLFEAGWGDYDLNNAFAWRGAFNGKADTNYYGGAVVVRHDSFCNGLYAEASVRAGSVDSDYKGQQSMTNFDTSAIYVGGHIGVGMLVDTWQDGQADVYVKGLFTHMGSDTVENSVGEELNFDGSLSARSRVGVRLSHNFMPTLKGYVGGAWEYEFDGTQKGTARMVGSSNVAKIPEIDVKGHTGIGELGVQWAAMENLSVGAGFQGSVGQRESYGGTARVMYKW